LLLALQSYFVTDDIIGCYKCMNYSDWIKVSFNVKALLWIDQSKHSLQPTLFFYWLEFYSIIIIVSFLK